MLFFQTASEYWLDFGFDGIKVSGLTDVANTQGWSQFQSVVQGNRTEGTTKR